MFFLCVGGRLSTVVNERAEDGGVGFIVKNGYNSIFFG